MTVHPLEQARQSNVLEALTKARHRGLSVPAGIVKVEQALATVEEVAATPPGVRGEVPTTPTPEQLRKWLSKAALDELTAERVTTLAKGIVTDTRSTLTATIGAQIPVWVGELSQRFDAHLEAFRAAHAVAPAVPADRVHGLSPDLFGRWQDCERAAVDLMDVVDFRQELGGLVGDACKVPYGFNVRLLVAGVLTPPRKSDDLGETARELLGALGVGVDPASPVLTAHGREQRALVDNSPRTICTALLGLEARGWITPGLAAAGDGANRSALLEAWRQIPSQLDPSYPTELPRTLERAQALHGRMTAAS